MAILDQIKTMMKSGDIAGAETLCRSHHAGRDVSTKRQRTRRGRVPTSGSQVESRKSKVATLWALAFVALLTPLAAWADIASPPNDYAHFSLSQHPSLHSPLDVVAGPLAILVIVAAITTLCLLAVVVFRIAKRRPVRAALAWTGVALGAAIGSFLGLRETSVWKVMVMAIQADPSGSFRPSPDPDTPERQAAFDRMCIEWYDTWEPSEVPLYMWGRHAPIPRDGAPQEVHDSHSRFIARKQAGIDAAPPGFGYGNTHEDPRVLEMVKEAARQAGENWTSKRQGGKTDD